MMHRRITIAKKPCRKLVEVDDRPPLLFEHQARVMTAFVATSVDYDEGGYCFYVPKVSFDPRMGSVADRKSGDKGRKG